MKLKRINVTEKSKQGGGKKSDALISRFSAGFCFDVHPNDSNMLVNLFTLKISVAPLSAIPPFSCVHVQRDHDFGTIYLKGDSSLDTFFGRGYEILKSLIFNLSAFIWSYVLEFACKHLLENKLLVFLEWDNLFKGGFLFRHVFREGLRDTKITNLQFISIYMELCVRICL